MSKYQHAAICSNRNLNGVSDERNADRFCGSFTGYARVLDVDTLALEGAVRLFTNEERWTLFKAVVHGTSRLTVALRAGSFTIVANATRGSVD